MTSIEKDLRELIVEWRRSSTTWIAPETIESLIPRIVSAVEQAQADAIQSAVYVCVKANQARGYAIAVAVAALTPRRVQIEAELRKLTVEVVTTKLCGELWDQEKGTACRELLVQLLAKKATLERELEAERKGLKP